MRRMPGTDCDGTVIVTPLLSKVVENPMLNLSTKHDSATLSGGTVVYCNDGGVAHAAPLEGAVRSYDALDDTVSTFIVSDRRQNVVLPGRAHTTTPDPTDVSLNNMTVNRESDTLFCGSRSTTSYTNPRQRDKVDPICTVTGPDTAPRAGGNAKYDKNTQRYV
jgi:hypothetical protein